MYAITASTAATNKKSERLSLRVYLQFIMTLLFAAVVSINIGASISIHCSNDNSDSGKDYMDKMKMDWSIGASLLDLPSSTTGAQRRLLYHEMQDKILQRIQYLKPPNSQSCSLTTSSNSSSSRGSSGKSTYCNFHFGDSSYNRAKVVQKAPWLPPRRQCRQNQSIANQSIGCCVETVAVSLAQDAQQIIHSRDGIDLADLIIMHTPDGIKRQPFIKFQGTFLQPEFLPCLVPGTVIFVDNHQISLIYFWKKVRPQIKVPYVLITAGSDGDSPSTKADHVIDPLMLRWYGSNPNPDFHVETNPQFAAHQHKFRPLNLGLSGFTHTKQETYLLPYLQLTNFSNPFQDKSRWDLTQSQPLNFDKDVFVHFRLDREVRKKLWSVLCDAPLKNSSIKYTNSVSCGTDTKKVPVENIYADMSQYRFGVSPPGMGWDCYRTYEMLLLGTIPILVERGPLAHKMFDGLPVIFIRTADLTSRQQLIDIIQNYLLSDAFQRGNFTNGWNRLFQAHVREEILRDAHRDHEILVDPQTGQRYYQGYHYSLTGSTIEPKKRFCETPGDCLTQQEINTIQKYTAAKDPFYKNPAPVLEDADKFWVNKWERAA